jgi:hypothetical protein
VQRVSNLILWKPSKKKKKKKTIIKKEKVEQENFLEMVDAQIIDIN